MGLKRIKKQRKGLGVCVTSSGPVSIPDSGNGILVSHRAALILSQSNEGFDGLTQSPDLSDEVVIQAWLVRAVRPPGLHN